MGSKGKSPTKSSTVLALVYYPARARRGHAHCSDAGENQPSYPYKMKAQDMTQRYLRRIHNHALGMEWLLKSVIPRLQWPKPVFKEKRAIMAEEHAAIIQREQNAERRDFYELLWLTGAAQSDGACLQAEDINWQSRTICFTRKKLKSRGTSIKPTLFRFSADIESVTSEP